MPYQWLIDILIWMWDNIGWILKLGIFIFFYSLIAPVKKTVNNVKQSTREIFTWDGFIIFVLCMILALLLSGLLEQFI